MRVYQLNKYPTETLYHNKDMFLCLWTNFTVTILIKKYKSNIFVENIMGSLSPLHFTDTFSKYIETVTITCSKKFGTPLNSTITREIDFQMSRKWKILTVTRARQNLLCIQKFEGKKLVNYCIGPTEESDVIYASISFIHNISLRRNDLQKSFFCSVFFSLTHYDSSKKEEYNSWYTFCIQWVHFVYVFELPAEVTNKMFQCRKKTHGHYIHWMNPYTT